jgi:peptidoglycan/xylan/chitin deacetylase (PgdA/CDA1 family)
MDHEHYDWSPLNARRAPLRWPENARVALCVIVTLEHLEWSRPPGSFQLPTLAGGYGPGPFPDVTGWSHREYGHRVGIFRVLDVLARHGVTPTIAMDVLTAEHYPFLVRHCLGRGAEIMAHGISVSRMITSRMSDEEEREYIQAGAIPDPCHRHSPRRLAGAGAWRVYTNAPVARRGGSPLRLRLGER